MEIGKIIKEIRDKKQVKIYKLSQMVGVTIDELYAIEHDTIQVNDNLYRLIFEKLGEDYDEIKNKCNKQESTQKEMYRINVPIFKVGDRFIFINQWDEKYNRPTCEVVSISPTVDRWGEYIYFIKMSWGSGDSYLTVEESKMIKSWKLL